MQLLQAQRGLIAAGGEAQGGVELAAVIASEAKQSSCLCVASMLDCFVASLLAMT